MTLPTLPLPLTIGLRRPALRRRGRRAPGFQTMVLAVGVLLGFVPFALGVFITLSIFGLFP